MTTHYPEGGVPPTTPPVVEDAGATGPHSSPDRRPPLLGEEQGADKGSPRRASIVPSGQDYETAKEEIASLIREKIAPGLRAPTNDSIKQAYGLVIEALYEEWAERDSLREWAFGQLDRIVNAVRGEPEPLHQHSLHDVAERVEKAMSTRVLLPTDPRARS